MKDLNQEQIIEILQNYRELKKRYTEILIDCISNPRKPEYQMRDDGGNKIFLKDYFELKIKEESEKNAEEKRRDKENLALGNQVSK